jgi:AcrR family transcriptional regulator
MSEPGINPIAAVARAAIETNPLSFPGRRTRRGDQTRARILDAARSSFRAVGWNRARVEDVCRTAGIGHGTFYAYYGNKVAVLEALVRQHAAALYLLAEEPWMSGDVRADVGRVIAGFVNLSDVDRDIREIWAAAAPSEPALASLVDEVRAQFVARVRENLSAAVDSGLARQEIDVDLAATALAAMVEHTVAVADPQISTQRIVAGLTDLWVSAVYR